MPAARADAVARHQEPWTVCETGRNRVAQREVRSLVRAENADGGESCQQRAPRVGAPLQRLLGGEAEDALHEAPVEVLLRFAGDVDVRVGEPREERRVAQND